METRQSKSQQLLDRIRRNEPTLTTLQIRPGAFEPTESAGLAQLGDAIANNTHLQRLEFDDQLLHLIRSTREFIDGVRLNSSICDIRASRCSLNERTTGYDILGIFRAKGNLTKVCLQQCQLDNDKALLLAVILQNNKNISYVRITDSGLSDHHMLRLVAAFTEMYQLKALELTMNNIGKGGCEALAAWIQDPNCSLISLCLGQNNIDDYGIRVLSWALARNNTLKKLYLDHNAAITTSGWEFLSQALCNTSSINATYCSNHTLTSVGDSFGTLNMPEQLSLLLAWNRTTGNKKTKAVTKILRYHPHFDMEPFLEWDLKLLPYIINWFDMVRILCAQHIGGRTARADKMRLDAIYQFTRAMPMRFVDVHPKNKSFLTNREMWLSIVIALLSFLLCVAVNPWIMPS